jgi:hypothetical protein
MSLQVYLKPSYLKKVIHQKFVKRSLCPYDKRKLRYILKNVKPCYIYGWILENICYNTDVICEIITRCNIGNYYISLQEIIKILNTFDKFKLQKLIDFFIPI